MLKNDRVMHMAKMAMYEKRNKNDLRIVTEYRRKDYISMSRIMAFVVGTIAYIFFFACIAATILYAYFSNVHTRSLVFLLLIGVVIYVVFMYFHMRNATNVAVENYKRSKGKYAKWKSMLMELNDMYDREDRQKSGD